jgi:hypothetical protein
MRGKLDSIYHTILHIKDGYFCGCCGLRQSRIKGLKFCAKARGFAFAVFLLSNKGVAILDNHIPAKLNRRQCQ